MDSNEGFAKHMKLFCAGNCFFSAACTPSVSVISRWIDAVELQCENIQ